MTCRSRKPGSWYGYSLALGSADIDLLHLTNAYRTLANGGRHSPVVFPPGARPHFTQVLDARAAFIVGDILSDRNAWARTFGTESVLTTRFWTAVKTGTSKDMRDNWAVGWSQRYTVGVWVGNASGAPMWSVSGTSGAAPVWAGMMRYLHLCTPSRAPAPPPGLVTRRMHYVAATEADRDEWFIAGTEQDTVARKRDARSRECERTECHPRADSRHRRRARSRHTAREPAVAASRQRPQCSLAD